MLEKEDLMAIAQIIDDRLNPVNARLDGIDVRLDSIDVRLDSMDERLSVVEENTTITREAVNKLLDWADDPSIQQFPLSKVR